MRSGPQCANQGEAFPEAKHEPGAHGLAQWNGGGAGLALLLGDKLNPGQRRAVGWTLPAIGILTTIPLVADVFGKLQDAEGWVLRTR